MTEEAVLDSKLEVESGDDDDDESAWCCMFNRMSRGSEGRVNWSSSSANMSTAVEGTADAASRSDRERRAKCCRTRGCRMLEATLFVGLMGHSTTGGAAQATAPLDPSAWYAW